MAAKSAILNPISTKNNRGLVTILISDILIAKTLASGAKHFFLLTKET